MTDSAYRERLNSKSIPELRKLATKYFNLHVRTRDLGVRCISCGSGHAEQAGHYFSAGHYPALAYNPDNCHRQCVKCNMYLSGNLIEYRKGLLSRIGAIDLQKLEDIASYYKRNGYKWQRESLIETIIKYK